MPESQETVDAMAAEIFELYHLVATARARRPAKADDLSETEFLTLDLLSKKETLTIGEVQKRIGVVPAQMSRIVRALEEQGGRGYVECRINPTDRRRVDVSLTQAGREAHERFRSIRLNTMYQVLTVLPPEDRFSFMRMMRLIRTAFQRQIEQK